MSNQFLKSLTEDKEMMQKLLNIRKNIDEIDLEIISLLLKRTKIIEEAKVLKDSCMDPNYCYITSAREANMVKDLIKMIPGTFPQEAIVNIWRNIISAANYIEKPLIIEVYDNDNANFYEAQNYFGSFNQINKNVDIESTFLKLVEKNVDIVVLPLVSDHIYKWWIDLAKKYPQFKIFQLLPFIRQSTSNINLVAISQIINEQTCEDISILVIESYIMLDKNMVLQILISYDFECEILDSNGNYLYLVQLNKYITNQDERIIYFNKINKHNCHIYAIGSFSTPIRACKRACK